MKTTLPITFLAITFLFSATVSAQKINPVRAALNFNVFINDDLTAVSGSVEGPAAAGNKLELSGSTSFAVNTTGTYPTGTTNSSANYGLVIGNKIMFSSGSTSAVTNGLLRLTNDNGSRIFYTDCNNSNTNLRVTQSGGNCQNVFNSLPNLVLPRQQTTGTATSAHNINFTDAFTEFAQHAQTIATYKNFSGSTVGFNRITIPNTQNPHITLADDKINFIHLTAQELTNLSNSGSVIFDNKPSATRTLFINVETDGQYTWNMPALSGLAESDGAFILWNFSTTTTLTLSGSNPLFGTVFAPLANIVKNNSNSLNGQIIGKMLTINGQINYHPFQGNLWAMTQNSTLPVKLLSFTGVIKNNKAELSWTVAQNEDGNYFEVEKSENGKDFSAAVVVFASSAAASETYTIPANLPASGFGYYRLKTVNRDHSVSYSGIIALRSSAAEKTDLQLLQNPVTTNLSFRFTAPASGTAHITLYTVSGISVMRKNIQVQNGTNLVSLPLDSQIPTGAYIMQLNAGNYQAAVRVIK